MQRSLALSLHATAAGIMTWGWFSLGKLSTVDDWMKTQKGGYYQFLTNQGLIITWSCMVASIFSDLLPSVAIFRRVKRALLLISMPLEFVITTIYWSLILFLPHLIARPIGGSHSPPGAVPQLLHLPLLIDLALHAKPLLALMIDFFVFEPKFTRGAVRKVAPVVVVIYTVWYASFVEYCASFNGSFPYPFLTFSPLTVRLLIYTSTAAIALGCFKVLNTLHT